MAKDPAAKAATDSKAAKGATPAKKPGRIKQLRAVLDQSRMLDPKIGWWMALAFFVTLAVAVGIGALVGWPVYAFFLGLPLAALAATIVMSRRAERAAYTRLAGQPGASGAALTSLRGGWFTDAEPVAVDADRGTGVAGAAMVFRALGRPGVVLVAEGPAQRATRVLAAERKKLERIAPGVPVTTLRVGEGEGDDVVDIRKLVSRVQRMKPVLTKEEVTTVHKRLKALGGVKMPLPHGMDPSRVRPDRRAMRGR